jgi:hypothetical protein
VQLRNSRSGIRTVATPSRGRSGSSRLDHRSKHSRLRSALGATARAVPRRPALDKDPPVLRPAPSVLRPARPPVGRLDRHRRVPAYRAPARRSARVATASHPIPPTVRLRATDGPKPVLSHVGRHPMGFRRTPPAQVPTVCALPAVPTPTASVRPEHSVPLPPRRTALWRVATPLAKAPAIGPGKALPDGLELHRHLLRDRRPMHLLLPMAIRRIRPRSTRAMRR